jgi:hypothetical protein
VLNIFCGTQLKHPKPHFVLSMFFQTNSFYIIIFIIEFIITAAAGVFAPMHMHWRAFKSACQLTCPYYSGAYIAGRQYNADDIAERTRLA